MLWKALAGLPIDKTAHRKALQPRLGYSLYGVETKALNQTIQRNIERFPADFMFQLTVDEQANLRSQIVISSPHGGRDRASERRRATHLNRRGHRRPHKHHYQAHDTNASRPASVPTRGGSVRHG